jgi:hypothetical protein
VSVYPLYPPPPPKYTIIERVAPRYDASLTVISRGWRVFKDKTKLILVSTGVNSTVATDVEELVTKATETLHDTEADPSKWKDFDDNTYTEQALGALETRNIVTYDFGTSRGVVAYFKALGSSESIVARLQASFDCSTFTTIAEGAYITVAVATAARCLRIQAYNSSADIQFVQIYTLEAYPITKELVVQGGARFLNIIAHGYTQLLEVIEL